MSKNRHIPSTPAEDDAWAEYIALARQSQQSLAVSDGIAAGKAWSRWLKLFEGGGASYSVEDGSNIVRLGARK